MGLVKENKNKQNNANCTKNTLQHGSTKFTLFTFLLPSDLRGRLYYESILHEELHTCVVHLCARACSLKLICCCLGSTSALLRKRQAKFVCCAIVTRENGVAAPSQFHLGTCIFKSYAFDPCTSLVALRFAR